MILNDWWLPVHPLVSHKMAVLNSGHLGLCRRFHLRKSKIRTSEWVGGDSLALQIHGKWRSVDWLIHICDLRNRILVLIEVSTRICLCAMSFAVCLLSLPHAAPSSTNNGLYHRPGEEGDHS